jgi:hypothetical protein
VKVKKGEQDAAEQDLQYETGEQRALVCTSCGLPADDDAVVCKNCGILLKPTAQDVVPPSPSKARSRGGFRFAGGKMRVVCENCASSNILNAKQCANCGVELWVAPNPGDSGAGGSGSYAEMVVPRSRWGR